MSVHFQSIGFKRSVTNMQRLGNDMVHRLEEPLNDIIDDMAEVEETVFNSQGRRGGGMWKRPSKRWQQRKARAKGDTRTLHASKRLRKSLTYRGSPDMIKDVNAAAGSIRFGTRVPYAHRHDKGTGGMPKRPIFRFTKFDKKRWAKIINKFVVSAYKRRARAAGKKL